MASPTKVCLNMIVKNESRIIENCLQSVLPAVDHYVICDTGSTDQTPDIIEELFARQGIKGEIHHIPFVNFGATRNQALDLCRASALDFDYALLVDADMELIVEDADFKTQLRDHAYDIRQANSISYYNTRLVRRDCQARYVGVTHEYLDLGARPARLPGVWFHDHACGANRTEKSERDIRLLTEGLRQEPGNVRYMFYLAQSCKDSGRFDDAIEWYKQRVTAGGWPEEVWYSLYMIARCHEQLGNAEQVMEYSLRAFDYHPRRAEPLWNLARFFREQNDYKACMMFAEMAEQVPYPQADSLFIEDYVYRTGIAAEISIAGYYCDDEDKQVKGRARSVQLATNRDANADLRDMALRNLYFYTQSAQAVFGAFSTKEVRIDTDPNYQPLNPSVWIDAAGPRCIVRSVNYRLDAGNYEIFDPANVIRTQNYLVGLDDKFAVAESHKMRDESRDAPVLPDFVEGYEDCRLFRCRGRYWCTSTVRNRSLTGRCEIAVLGLDDQFNYSEVHVIRSVNPELHQKNWAPLVHDDQLYLIYSSDPTVVLKYDFERHDVEVAYYGVPEPCLENFRGSSQAVRARDGWIYVTHEARWLDRRTCSYLHRFVTMSDDFRVTGFTEPFHFLSKGIEFCAGLAYDENKRQFVASFGVNDCKAHLGFFDEDAVYANVKDIASWC